MIIVTSYMFSSRCVRSIVFIEIHCEYVTFDRCTGCLHSHKKITWRSAPVFGTCLTSLPLLDAFGQKNRRMLAGIVCEFPCFWKWKCEGIAKTKEDICHISSMSCYRETKGQTFFLNRISFGDKYLYLVRREMTGYEPCLIGWCLWQISTLIFQLVSRCERRWSQDFQYCLAQRSLLL